MLKPEDIFGLGLWQPFKVASGGAPPAYSVVSLSGGDKDGRYFVNTAAKPSTTLKSKYGITGPFDITATGSDKRGVVCTAGYALVKYGDSSIAVDDFCGPKPDSWVLWKNHPGFRCVKVIDATNKIMLAERIDPLPLLVKADAKIATNTTGTCSVYIDTATDSTFNVTVRVGEYAPDLFADEFAVVEMNNKGEWYYQQDSKFIDGTLAGALAVGSSATMNVDPGSDTVTVHDAVLKTGSADIASGKKIYAGWFKLRKRWQVIQAECP